MLVKSLISAILAFILGCFVLALVFSDLETGESWMERIFVITAFFFACGVGIGFFNPKQWLISVITAWGAVLTGGFIVFSALRKHGNFVLDAQEPPFITFGLAVLFLPAVLALFGGYLGKLLKGKIFPNQYQTKLNDLSQ